MSAPSDSVKRARGWALVIAGMIAASVALHAAGFGGPFLSDDFLYLHNSETLNQPVGSALRRILTTAYFTVGNWSPVHQLVLLAEWHALGKNPVGYRVVNAILHAVGAALFGAALRRGGLGRGASAFGAALLLVHPVAAEPVNWINQSKTLLASAFSLLAIERWLAHLDAPSRGRRNAVWAAGVLALLSKPSALLLVAVLAVASTTHGRPGQRRLRDLMPLAVATGVALLMNLLAQTLQGGVSPWFGGGPLGTAQILPWLRWRYVRLSLLPYDLVHGVHPAPIAGWDDPRLWLPLLGLLLVAAGLFLACRRQPRRIVAVVWFLAMLAPVLQVVPMINLFADRYLYVALPGALALTADAAGAIHARARGSGRAWAPNAVLAAGVAVLMALGAVTVTRAQLWAHPESLYEEAAHAYPLGRTGWTGMGAERHRRGDLEGAVDAYLSSLAVFPDDGNVRQLLGRIRLRQRRPRLALYDFEETLRLNPYHPDAEWIRRRVERLRAQGVTPMEDWK